MRVSRLASIPGIGVDKVGDAADAAADPEILRLDNLDTDLRPPAPALIVRRAVDDGAPGGSFLLTGRRRLQARRRTRAQDALSWFECAHSPSPSAQPDGQP